MQVGRDFRLPQKFTWRVVYLRMVRRLLRLRSMYESESIELSTAYAEFDAFFLDTNHLQEWLKKDETSEYALNPRIGSQAEGWMKKHHALKIAMGYANTSKHVKRGDEGKMHAQIDGASFSGAGRLVVVLHVTQGRDTTYECDAMTVAEACARDWEAFLVKHSIEVPVP